MLKFSKGASADGNAAAGAAAHQEPGHGYRTNPAAYAREVLGVCWWHKQAEVAEALMRYRRVFVKASHSVGKSFLAGGLVNWFFDCFDPGICITTAPNAVQVRDILWKEVRVQRPAALRGVLQPKAPRMETGPDHFAVGYTSRDGSGFQGRHEAHVLIVFDECVGVAAPFWDAAEGMMTGDDCYFLAICNPTDTGSRAFIECQNLEKWHVIEISALEHPNIAADLAGLPPPYPKAVRMGWVQDRIRDWCERLNAEGARAGDFEFPPGSGMWYRPGPLFESRVLGRWPTAGSSAVWSEAAWSRTLIPTPLHPTQELSIGCDVARFGDDFTSIVVRRGSCVLRHESHNGWSTAQTAGRLKQLATEFAVGTCVAPEVQELSGSLTPSELRRALFAAGVPRGGEDPKQVPIYIDDDGVGGGVTDQAGEYDFVPVSSAERALDRNGYPNRRSELWFAAAHRAAEGRLDLSRLSEASRALLQRQLMAPTWRLDSQGRRVVEAKADTKRRIGRSPDDADALNLAFAAVPRAVLDAEAHAQFWSRLERERESEAGDSHGSGWSD